MRHTLQTPAATLTYADTGAGAPSLIFLHYWGGSARTWDPVIARLAPALRCIALDQRGWGGASALDGQYGLDALADDVLALVAALGLGAFVLVGHSMGGKVAQIVAKRRPPGLSGLVLLAPAPPIPMAVPPVQRAAMLDSYQSRTGVLQALEVLAGTPLPEALREQVIADTLAGHPDAKRVWVEAGMLQDVSAGLGHVTVPVEILVGEQDRVERLADLRAAFAPFWPRARFASIAGAGHLTPLEAPEAVAAACTALLGGADF